MKKCLRLEDETGHHIGDVNEKVLVDIKKLRKLEKAGVYKYSAREGLGGAYYEICEGGCPVCKRDMKRDKHKPGCWLGNLLNDKE